MVEKSPQESELFNALELFLDGEREKVCEVSKGKLRVINASYKPDNKEQQVSPNKAKRLAAFFMNLVSQYLPKPSVEDPSINPYAASVPQSETTEKHRPKSMHVIVTELRVDEVTGRKDDAWDNVFEVLEGGVESSYRVRDYDRRFAQFSSFSVKPDFELSDIIDEIS